MRQAAGQAKEQRPDATEDRKLQRLTKARRASGFSQQHAT
jgi:hypothetical protein